MVLDVITISRRQPRLRSQKGAKIIFLSGVALYGCVFTLEGFVKNARFLSTTHLLPHGKFSWQQLLWKKMGGGKKKSNCSSIPREKKPVILSPTWCLTYFHKFARKYASRYCSRTRGKRRLFLVTLGEIEEKNFQRVTRVQRCLSIVYLLRRGETWKNINGEERSRAFFARLTSRYARRPQSKECQNICITSSDDRLFCFAQHLFEFTTRYVYAFSVAYPRFYFVACRLVELVEFINTIVWRNRGYIFPFDRSIVRTYSTISRTISRFIFNENVCLSYRMLPISLVSDIISILSRER